MLNWVFADGPPNVAQNYDNNDYQDFHAIVTKSTSEDVYWSEVEKEIYQSIRDGTLAKEAKALSKVNGYKQNLSGLFPVRFLH
jgi:starch synthase